MRRTEIDGTTARYRVRRVAWAEIGWALLLRLCLANIGAVLGALALTQGWFA